MRTFHTLRDAEIAYGELENRVASLETKLRNLEKSPSGSGPRVPNRFTVINAANTAQPAIDIDSNNDNGVIIHRLSHNFYGDVLVNIFNTHNGINIIDTNTGTRWFLGPFISDAFQFLFVDPSGTPKIFQMEFRPDTTTPYVYFPYDIGTLADQVNKVWTKDLQVTANTPNIGDVLTAVDADGNVEWGPGGGGGALIHGQQAATGGLVLSTTVQDVPGASLTLTQNGVYRITGTFYVYKDALDDIALISIDYNGSTAAQGYFGQNVASGTINMRSMVTLTKDITVTGAPKTVKLRASKVTAAAGSSTIGGTDTIIHSLFLG